MNTFSTNKERINKRNEILEKSIAFNVSNEARKKISETVKTISIDDIQINEKKYHKTEEEIMINKRISDVNKKMKIIARDMQEDLESIKKHQKNIKEKNRKNKRNENRELKRLLVATRLRTFTMNTLLKEKEVYNYIKDSISNNN